MLNQQVESWLGDVAKGHEVASLFIEHELHPVVLATCVSMNGHFLQSCVRQYKSPQAHVSEY